MRPILSVIFSFFVSLAMSGQPDLPAVVPLHDAEDYQEAEALAVEAMDWLMNTPLDEQEEERSRLNVFCMEWIAGHPSYRVELNSALLPFATKHPQLLYVHIYACIEKIMEDPDSDMVDYNEAGIRAVLKSAGITKGLNQCETLSNIIKAADEHQLREWVEGRVYPERN